MVLREGVQGREGYRNNMVVYGFEGGCGVDGWLSGSAWSSFLLCLEWFLKKKKTFFLGKGWF